MTGNDTWAEEHKGVIGASEAGHCARAIGYRLLGYEPLPFSPTTLAIFERGHALEPVIADIKRREGYWVERYKQLPYTSWYNNEEDRIWLVANPDYYCYKDGEDYNLQVKAVNPYHGKSLVKNAQAGRLVEETPQYYWQVQAEMAAIKEHFMLHTITKTILCVCDVATMKTTDIVIPFDEEIWNVHRQKLEQIWYNATIDGELAPREYAEKEWQCSYCNYKQHCYS